MFYCRSLKFTINQQHTYNFPVYAVIDEPSLELSSNSVVLFEQCSTSVDTGTLIHLCAMYSY